MTVLSLQELAQIQRNVEEQIDKLGIEILKRATAENIPPKEICEYLPLYREKLRSTDSKRAVPTLLKDIVDDVIEDIRKRSERRQSCR